MLKTLIKHWLGFAAYSNYVEKRFTDESTEQNANYYKLEREIAELKRANKELERHINYLQMQDKETQGNG